METENKSKISKSKKTAIILVIVLLLLAVAASLAYYFSILKGENVNTAKTSSASLSYTEPQEGIVTEQMTDEAGKSSSKTYDFSVTGQAGGSTSIDYAIYLEEVEGNTISADQIRVYLTDENDIPINVGDYDGVDMGTILYDQNGKFLFEYALGHPNPEYNFKHSIYTELDGGALYDGDILNYLIEEKLKLSKGSIFYIKNSFVTDPSDKENTTHYVCSKYEVAENNEYKKLGLVDNSNCQNAYELVTIPQAMSITELNDSPETGFEDITNVIKYSEYNFTSGKINTDKYSTIEKERYSKNTRHYKLRYWVASDANTSTDTTNKEITSSSKDKQHQADFASTGEFKFKVNIYAKQKNVEVSEET